MHHDRISAELPPEMRTWLTANANADLWDRIGRLVAIGVGQRLLVNSGEAGWDRILYALLVRDASPAVRACATALGCDPIGRRCRRP